ncbi:hypothetical protein JW905_05165, partial [bacterium]|nr:hypothetical protein [candidate division CSSED10-310 bacterium]
MSEGAGTGAEGAGKRPVPAASEPFSRRRLIRTLAVGFMPILVYILIEGGVTKVYGEQTGIKAGLAFALLFGMGAFGMVWIRERRLDGLVLLDTLLLMLMGGLSLGLNDPLLFKLKPALIEAVLLVLIGLTAFTSHTLLIDMGGRYLKGVSFSEEQLGSMRRMMRMMFMLILVHIVLIVYSAAAMDRKWWAFISGPLFYVALLAVPAASFVRTRFTEMRGNGARLLLVDDTGRPLGGIRPGRSAAAAGGRLAGLVMLVVDDRGGVLLCPHDRDSGDAGVIWGTPVQGLVPAGLAWEDFITALVEVRLARRRIPFEELGYLNLDDERGNGARRLHLRMYRGFGASLRGVDDGRAGSFVDFREVSQLCAGTRLDLFTHLAVTS